ncbi:MAG TPA: hypothetical protein VKR53_19535 [Puia sp.]|nr:hypothetical protein [Puia sp.]
MPVAFTIHVTKEILARAKYCGQDQQQFIGDKCAIAVALQDLFPNVFVTGNHIHPFGFDQEGISEMTIVLPLVAQNFIKVFDSLVAMPRVRLLLPELAFDIIIPDRVIEQINIDDIKHMKPVQMAY